jgi:uncharacterized protein DUF1572
MPSAPATSLAQTTLETCLDVLRKQKALGERALSQLDDQQLFEMIDSEANSIAVIVKHLHGNMRSRWSDFLTTDGEKPDRNRDSEFVISEGERTRDVVIGWWNAGWACVFKALESLEPHDLDASVMIRGQKMTVIAAILRQVDHYGQHIGQIVLLAKHFKGSNWLMLSIPKGKSAEFEAEFRKKLAAKEG